MDPRTILLVDDEPHVTLVLSGRLRAEGYEVITAEDGSEALELTRFHSPDLVITDYQMPTLSGFELAQKLRANPLTSDTPVFMLTARGHMLTDEELAQTSIRLMMAKPFSARVMCERVREIFESPGSFGGVRRESSSHGWNNARFENVKHPQ